MAVVALGYACQAKKADTTATDATMTDSTAVVGTELVLKVTGMTCEACETKITDGLKTLPGVLAVSASNLDSTATLTIDTTLIQKGLIVATIAELGYVAE